MQKQAEPTHEIKGDFGSVADKAGNADDQRSDEQMHRRLGGQDVAVENNPVGHARGNVKIIAVAKVNIGDAEARHN